MMDISKKIEQLKEKRKALLHELQDVSVRQIVTIPPNYNNNVLWNVGHILVIPQYYFYAVKGNDPHIDRYFIQHYMSGTKPQAAVGEEELDAIKRQLLPVLDNLESDYRKGMFARFAAFGNLDFAGTLDFLTNHETMHMGKINQMLRLTKDVA